MKPGKKKVNYGHLPHHRWVNGRTDGRTDVTWEFRDASTTHHGLELLISIAGLSRPAQCAPGRGEDQLKVGPKDGPRIERKVTDAIFRHISTE